MKSKFRIIITITILIFTFLFYAKQLKMHKINTITVFGNIVTNYDDIKKSVNSTNMYNFDINKTKKNILKLHWVRDCIIRKIWPNEIVVFLEEEIPIFEYSYNYYININGKKLPKSHIPKQNYPISRIKFRGTFVEHEMRDVLNKLLKYPEFADYITEIERMRELRFDIIINNNVKIKCMDNNMEQCIVRYLTLPANAPWSSVIDFRHPQRTMFYDKNHTL
ncbi:cell division protein FtsQ/DivIB [Candidatus Cytomitobacter primus]|uniref:FtsQ-type POTRA domain-containing protein n=1 Tax=Candidatus Cytomitobacter primus TaxID=2066024 RepID=A0A5C0UGG5_9PROT|nr:FtsQ-type POTRA domain-containing protein [Candidatus Cytomitobacter primus]QEK38761.1 FtsQ-type POTRA domain-containing protein [Candidatus Cytomitobacter primus]